MAKYELTVVFDSLQKDEEMQRVVSKTENFITNNGGEIHKIDEWGKKRLAYEINRKQYGNYYQFFFEVPSNVPALMEKELRLEDSVLRYLTLASDYDPADFSEEENGSSGTEEKAEPAQKESASAKSEEEISDSEEESDSGEEESEEAVTT